MGDWDTIAGWSPAELKAVGDDLAAELKRLRGTEAELRDATTPAEWEGEAAEAAKRSLAEIERGLLHRVEEFAMLRAAVDDAAERLERLHGAMHGAAEFARAHDFEIAGGVVRPRPGAPANPDPDVRAHLEAQVQQIVRTGLDIDADLTTVMRSVLDGKGHSDASTMTKAAAAGAESGQSTLLDPPKDATPAQNKAWWDTLSDDERKWLIAQRPELIGNRKGIPYQARHEANVNRIALEREKLRELRENLKDWTFVLERAKEVGIGKTISDLRGIDEKLKALDVLERQAEDNSIVSLDTSGDRVRAAVAIGDVDNADYVAVYTPGMNSAVEDNMNRYVDELREVNQYAQDMLAGTGETVATVVWMDYEPPKTSVDEIVEGIFDDRAEDGAKRLAAELEGLEASRMDDPPERITAIGHSYGSLTTALALRESDAADAFVSQGSPGWNGDDGLKVPAGELYNLRTDGDLIAGSGWYGGSPENYDGVRQLETDDAVTADGERLAGSEGHSGYTEADRRQSTSEYNTAAVITGRDDLLIEREHADSR
ncbi:alpha/beta hydrolase [Thermocrispum municipale]|uniref:alpha/beta hydrolase n=1 Tax=Thermocrispum municipale TaxID=37926 RepID=UPI00040B0AFE|nr:alpha/beta hydrolase [Thermocrispum municipale]